MAYLYTIMYEGRNSPCLLNNFSHLSLNIRDVIAQGSPMACTHSFSMSSYAQNFHCIHPTNRTQSTMTRADRSPCSILHDCSVGVFVCLFFPLRDRRVPWRLKLPYLSPTGCSTSYLFSTIHLSRPPATVLLSEVFSP